MYQRSNQGRPRSRNQKGYILLSVMLLITLMLVALSVELPRIAQQVKREKEEELVHRGMDYARAVKRFHHKSNQYPSSIEQLKDTNHIRFLRKEYKDPMTGESEWKLVHVNEAEIKIPAGNGPQGLQGANPGLTGGATPGGQPAGTAGINPGGGTTGSSGFSGGSSGISGGGTGLSGGGTGLSGGSSGLSGGGTGLSGGGTGLSGGSNTGLSGNSTTPGQGSGSAQTGGVASPGGSGSLQTSGIGLNNPVGQTFGGGQIIGFASTSKKTSIKEFNDKNEYDQWYFVYDPRLEQQGPNQIGSANGGLTIAAPRGGAAAQGTPAGLQGSTTPQTNGQPATPAPQVPR
jgi:type II secretory pathway pseudopilin PulG